MRQLLQIVRIACGALILNWGSTPGMAAEGLWRDPGTARMVERLEEILRAANPMDNPFMNRERAQVRAQQAALAQNPIQALNTQTQWAMELLYSGQTDQAIQVFDHVAEVYAQNQKVIPEINQVMLRNFRAIAYLRQAEDDNCLTNHTSESCLFPIQGAGVHRTQRGSRSAIRVLTEQLRHDPNDLRARWWLNLAYMTLGEYPAKVPAEWHIGPQVFDSHYRLKRFPEIAGSLGLDIDDLAGGSIAEDFDGDGYLDIMASSMAVRGQLRYFRNNADGTFTERTKEAGLTGEFGGLNIVQTDYNNDGFPDVLVLRGGWMMEGGKFPNSLLRNNGNGTFSDVTEAAGLLSFHPTQTATWFDYNSDGWLDLFIGNETSGETKHPSELFRNNQDGTFTECAATNGLAITAFVKAVVSGDYNNDGRPDLYLSVRDQPNILLRNDGPNPVDKVGAANGWKFTDVTTTAGVGEPIMSFPAWFFDFDNDGWQDLFVSGYDLKSVGDAAADYLGLPHDSARPKLYRNNRNGTFADVTKAAGLDHVLHTMGCNYGDLDSDGYLDFYLGTGDPNLGTLLPNRMFRNASGQRFQDVTTAGGFGHLQKGHGVSFADFDNDGDQDIYSVIGGAYSGDHYRNVFFENPGHSNRWICLELVGKHSNRPGLGARIKVTVATAAGPRTIHKTVSTGSSFGANPFRQEIGLGEATGIQSIEVVWPRTGQTQTIRDCRVDRFYQIYEGQAAAVERKLKTFKLRSSVAPGHHEHAHH